MASDKLFYFLFHNTPDLILRWLQDLPADAGGYRFSAPVLKEREYRLDGLFSPPEQHADLPAVVLEAQMQDDPEFVLRLQPEDQLRSVSDALRQQALNDARAAEVLPLIPAILLARFNTRPLQEICAWAASPSRISPRAGPTRRSLAWVRPAVKPAAARKAGRKAGKPRPQQ